MPRALLSWKQIFFLKMGQSGTLFAAQPGSHHKGNELACFKGQLGEDFLTVSIFLSFSQEGKTGA